LGFLVSKHEIKANPKKITATMNMGLISDLKGGANGSRGA
jgi:hypothetical protein